MNNDVLDIIPLNTIGKPVDLEFSVENGTVAQAMETYHGAYCKLRHPFLWKDFSGAAGTEFTLVKGGHNTNLRALELGDYIKIDLPGPGPKNGNGYDWVKVELVEDNVVPGSNASYAIRLRACANPEYAKEDEIAAHFFKDTATSTFIIKRNELKVTASYAGRNEVPNLKDAGLHDKIRNAAVAFAATAGFSELQWNGFIRSLVEHEI